MLGVFSNNAGRMQNKYLMAMTIRYQFCLSELWPTCMRMCFYWRYPWSHKRIFQIRQTKDAKLSNSKGGNGLFIQLSGQRSFVFLYTYSCLRILERHNFHYQFMARQSPFITPKFPPFPSESYHIPYRLVMMWVKKRKRCP